MIGDIKTLERDYRRLEKSAPQSAAFVEASLRLAWEIALRDNVRARALTEAALPMAQEQKLTHMLALAYRNLSYLAFFQSGYKESLALGQKSLSYFAGCKDKQGEATVYDTLSHLYRHFGMINKSLSHATKSLELSRAASDKRGEAWALHNIANLYVDIGDRDQALSHYEQAKEIFAAIPYEIGLVRIYGGMASVYNLACDWRRALPLFKRSLKLSTKLGIKIGIHRSYNDIGRVYLQLGKFDRAYEAISRGLDLCEQDPDLESQAYLLRSLAEYYAHSDQHEEAAQALHKGFAIAEKLGSKKMQAQYHETSSLVTRLRGDLKAALEHAREADKLASELKSAENQEKLQHFRLGEAVESARRDADVQRLKNIEIAGTLDRLTEAQSHITESGKFTSMRFIARGFVAGIEAPLSQLQASTDEGSLQWQEKIHADGNGISQTAAILRKKIDVSRDAAKEITGIMQALRQFTMLDEAPWQQVDPAAGLDSLRILMQSALPDAVSLVWQREPLQPSWCSPLELNMVYLTLVANAMEALEGKAGEIVIQTRQSQGCNHIRIQDSGSGFNESSQQHVFDIGVQQSGNGLFLRAGLANAQRIVQQHDGEITLNSAPGEGSIFDIQLPVKVLKMH